MFHKVEKNTSARVTWILIPLSDTFMIGYGLIPVELMNLSVVICLICSKTFLFNFSVRGNRA